MVSKKDFKLEDVVMQEEEVSDVKWVTVEEFVEMMRSKKVALSIEIYFELLMRIIEN